MNLKLITLVTCLRKVYIHNWLIDWLTSDLVLKNGNLRLFYGVRKLTLRDFNNLSSSKLRMIINFRKSKCCTHLLWCEMSKINLIRGTNRTGIISLYRNDRTIAVIKISQDVAPWFEITYLCYSPIHAPDRPCRQQNQAFLDLGI